MKNKYILLIYIVLFLIVSGECRSDSTITFNANYDVVVNNSGIESHLRSREKVKNGEPIRLMIQKQKIELKLTGSKQNTFELELSVFDKIKDNWEEISEATVLFKGNLGSPSEFSTQYNGLDINLAIIVSVIK